MKVIETELPGLLVIEPRIHGDARGFLVETWNRPRYEAAGIRGDFCQDNVSLSRRGTLRGLHYQWPYAQDKLVWVLQGEVLDVALDIRRGSPTFGRWYGVTLSGESLRQFYIPRGFAHGFCVLSETALFAYKCTETYHPEAERGILWSDPDIGIDWPLRDVLLSERDQHHPLLKEMPLEHLPALGDWHTSR